MLPDPRAKATPQDLQAQFDFLKDVQQKLTETHDAIRDMRTIRGQLKTVTTPLKARPKPKTWWTRPGPSKRR